MLYKYFSIPKIDLTDRQTNKLGISSFPREIPEKYLCILHYGCGKPEKLLIFVKKMLIFEKKLCKKMYSNISKGNPESEAKNVPSKENSSNLKTNTIFVKGEISEFIIF